MNKQAICKNCNKSFPELDSRKRIRKFCSQQCVSKYKSPEHSEKIRLGVLESWSTRKKPSNRCPKCNKVIVPTARACKKHKVTTESTKQKLSIAKIGKKQSIETLKKLSKIRTGKTAWNKGKNMTEEQKAKLSISQGGNGNPNLKKAIRNLLQYKKWRTAVFKRDDYTCKHCGVRGNKLNADHYPNYFASLIKDNKITKTEDAINCEMFWSIDNGRTLCIECHKKTENYLTRINR